MIVSVAGAQWNKHLPKDKVDDRDKTRAVRARQRAIGRELRRFYDGVVNEPVPDEFLDILRGIDQADAPDGQSGKKSG